MSRCRGEFFVKDLGLYEVKETTIYTWVKWLIRVAWILFIFVLLVPGLKGSGSTLLKIFIVLTVLGIVIGTTLPGQVKKDLKEAITQKIETYTAPVMTKAKEYAVGTTQYANVKLDIDITKIAHFCLFALLAFLLLLKDSSRSIRLILLELFMLACATECMQFYIDGRSPLVTDVVIDMAGGVVGMVAGKYLFNGRLTAH
ncbi:vanZ like family protein [bacterium BMS3Abin13]|nr:vanZ like family protein [bacterium BMS3Abin13]